MALTMLGDKGAVSGAMAAKVKNAQVTSTMDAVMSGISSPDYCTIAATVVWVLTALARIIYELVFYRDTPQQLTILLCLLSPGLFTLLVIYVVNYLRENNGAESQKKPKRATATQVCLLGLIICTTVVTGGVWVFTLHFPPAQHNSGRTVFNNNVFSRQNLFLFTFCNAVWDIYAIVFILLRSLKAPLCEEKLCPAVV
nr:uncharacterized protein LOC122766622 isoform X2 [Solea senegalensis]